MSSAFCASLDCYDTHSFFSLQSVVMAFSLLPVLRPGDWRATIRVPVCRKWEYRCGTDDGPIQHVDLVLVDEKVSSLLTCSSFALPVLLLCPAHVQVLNQCSL